MGHVDPGGQVSVQIDGGNPLTTTALADETQDPMAVSGFSPVLTFGLLADTDTAGHPARTDLMMDGAAVEVDLGSSRTHLEVHAAGSGCVGATGVVHLRVTGGALDGDFTADGTRQGGPMPGAACHFAGTLAGIPIAR